MLIKEYRILLPLTVDEYRIAQLYMIQKKSRVDTSGAGSGVEIIKNEPYVEGPGGSGQYTYKIFHIGSHLPAWFRAILPATALQVQEEAWNAYPYTRTKYTCPFIPRFSLDVETRYYNDPGSQKNVFNLRKAELNQRIVDVMDIVNDPISFMDYLQEEDPKLFVSKKTGRGPLSPDWVRECAEAAQPVMCAYKLCKVEFKYWGMQTRIEKFIQDVALRKTMLRAHRQAWAWQDEWHGLSMDDIRDLEKEAQEHLATVMAEAMRPETEDNEEEDNDKENVAPSIPVVRVASTESRTTTTETVTPMPMNMSGTVPSSGSSGTLRFRYQTSQGGRNSPQGSMRSRSSSAAMGGGRGEILDLIRSDSETDSDGEFFDANEDWEEEPSRPVLVRWSSREMEPPELSAHQALEARDSCDRHSMMASNECRVSLLVLVFHAGSVLDTSFATPGSATTSQENLPTVQLTTTGSTKSGDLQTFRATVEAVMGSYYPQLTDRVAVRCVACPVFSAEALQLLASLSPYGNEGELGVVQPALVPLLATRSPHYEEAVSQAVVRANQVYKDFLSSEEGQGFSGDVYTVGDAMGGILAFDAVLRDGKSGLSRNPSQVSGVTDGTDVSAVIPEDEEEGEEGVFSGPGTNGVSNHPRLRHSRDESKAPPSTSPGVTGCLSVAIPAHISHHISASRQRSLPFAPSVSSPTLVASGPPTPRGLSGLREASRRCRSHSLEAEAPASSPGVRYRERLAFRPSDLFLFGSPLGLVLSERRLARPGYPPHPPHPLNLYNLYYAQDPCCARLEPLLCGAFAAIEPVNVPKFSRFPLGSNQSLHIYETVQRNLDTLLAHQSPLERHRLDTPGKDGMRRKLSNLSINSDTEPPTGNPITSVQALLSHWWGLKRVDYALYCPDGLANFPPVSLPNLVHASFWESSDVAAFLLRQFLQGAQAPNWDTPAEATSQHGLGWVPPNPTEKWTRKRTSFKIKNASANHRGNDIICGEAERQRLSARFMYGPLDVVALTGEVVDIYVREEESGWRRLGEDRTDSHGRITFTIPKEKTLPLGLHPIKMIVRGDHTYLDMFMAVVPPKTECVVFSIDGSFTASVSVSGKDPKVRAGAVDVVRLWQDLGYLILYITARPDIQQRKVIAWLAQHNFPHGLLYFSDKITTDPLRQKTSYLSHLVGDCGMMIRAAYGSSKDIGVYSAAGLKPDSIIVVGKSSKKHQGEAVFLADGYSAHLSQLSSGSLHIARPAQGNGRLLLRKSNFALPAPGAKNSLPVQRSHSFTPRLGQYEDGASPTTPSGARDSLHKKRGLSPFRFSVRKSKD